MSKTSEKQKAIELEIKARLAQKALAHASTGNAMAHAAMALTMENVVYTANTPDSDTVKALQDELHALTPKVLAMLPPWSRLPCPEWFTRRGLDQFNNPIQVRNNALWLKHQKAAWAYAASGDCPIIGGMFDIPMPCNVARLCKLIDDGNMALTIIGAPEVLANLVRTDGTSNGDGELNLSDTLLDALGALQLNTSYAPIIHAAGTLSKAHKALQRAKSTIGQAHGGSDYEKAVKRFESAQQRYNLALAVFGQTWADRHTVVNVEPVVEPTPVEPVVNEEGSA